MSNRIRILAALTAVSMTLCAAGCTEDSSRSRRDRDDGGSAFADKDPTEETTEQTTASETQPSSTTVSPEETAAVYANSNTDEFNYYAFMNFVYNYNQQNPGYEYGFERSYTDRYEWTLVISDPEAGTSDVYVVRDDVFPEVYETRDFVSTNAADYDVFIQLPTMTEIGHCTGTDNIYEAPEDGRYFGNLLGAADDGTYILAALGEAIVLTEAEYNALEVGDIIPGHPSWNSDFEFVVTDITGSGSNREVEVCNGELWFSHGYAENPTDYVLTEASDNPVYTQTYLYALPLADNCDVTDTYSFLTGDSDFEVDPNAGPLVNSVFWHYSRELDPYRSERVNYWYEMDGLAYPVVVENGEVTALNIEWR